MEEGLGVKAIFAKARGASFGVEVIDEAAFDSERFASLNESGGNPVALIPGKNVEQFGVLVPDDRWEGGYAVLQIGANDRTKRCMGTGANDGGYAVGILGDRDKKDARIFELNVKGGFLPAIFKEDLDRDWASNDKGVLNRRADSCNPCTLAASQGFFGDVVSPISYDGQGDSKNSRYIVGIENPTEDSFKRVAGYAGVAFTALAMFVSFGFPLPVTLAVWGGALFWALPLFVPLARL